MKSVFIAAAATVLAASSALAATQTAPGTVIPLANQHVLLIPSKPTRYTPPLSHLRNLKTIFSDFATNYPKGPYNAFEGLPLSGPNTIHGQYWFASAFTPSANATMTEIDVAVGVVAAKRPDVQIGLYTDNAGEPGTLLWSHNAHVPVFGTCCAYVTLHDRKGIPLTGGTQYWVGVTTLPGNTTFNGAWTLNALDQVDSNLIAINTGAGWQAQQSVPNVAFGVFGK